MNSQYVKKLIKGWGWARVDDRQYVSDKDTAYSFYDKHGVFNIIVNPTNAFREWCENVLFFFNRRKEWGFISYSYRNVAIELFPQIDADYDGTSPINFWGASRGGAVCEPLYCMFEKKYNNNHRLHLYSYGKPPTVKETGYAYYASIGMNHTRVVNQGDCVPSIPKWGKQYHSELIEVDSEIKVPWWKSKCKSAHLGYGTGLAKS